jgi:lysophospholipase L1-like esterase
MATNRSGNQDRRGFDALLQGILLILLPSSLIAGYFVHWQWGLALFLFACIHFITWEAVSARPANNPGSFLHFRRTQDRRRPVLVCLGDSLTHGNIGASITPEIPMAIAAKLGMPTPDYGRTFNDPLWVVNAGQNGITSHTILTERLNSTLNLYPDYILILIGTNDVLAMYRPKTWGNLIVRINGLSEIPTLSIFQRNIQSIIEFLQSASPKSEMAIATLPPMGENLKSDANQLVQQANDIIASIARTKKIAILPLYEELTNAIKTAQGSRRFLSWPLDLWWLAAAIQCPCMHVFPLVGIITWNRLSKFFFGYCVLSDGIHLNESGRDILVQLIIEWLYERNIAKTIAVKA